MTPPDALRPEWPDGVTRGLQAAAEALWLALSPSLPGLAVEVQAQVASTNTRLMERARAGDATPCLLVARHQSAGRGRLGRAWQSRPGDSLTFSLALPLARADIGGLSLAVGVALADALEPPSAATPRLRLKWPNDLLLAGSEGDAGGNAAGRKLGGILIEALARGGPRIVVIGIGINLRALPSQGLSYGLASLDEINPAADAGGVLQQVVPPLVAALQRFDSAGFAPSMAAFARRDALAGRTVGTTLAEAPQGIADGVADDGALWLRVGPRRLRVVSGEVSVRLGPVNTVEA
ncbi:MAG: biotin--[acetyl-CoA-carboxylase] ligase [Aquabacterium sp.]